jgi:hypothetical protein
MKQEINSYADAVARLDGRDSVKLKGNTSLVRLDADTVAVRFHETFIVKYDSKGFELNTGGWKTPTTKARMNEFGPVSVRSVKGVWHADGVEFFDGMRFKVEGDAIRPPAVRV